MKSFLKLKYVLLGMLATLFLACEDYLEEEFFSDVTAEKFIDENNADQLIAGIYANLRDIYKRYDINMYGTDVYSAKSMVQEFNSLNDYFGLSSDNGNIEDYWRDNYDLIADANIAINRYENQISWNDSNLGARDYGVAQARALRALAFYNLVQHFGGLVLDLEETTTIRSDYARSSEADTYAQIIEDLEAAIPGLLDAPDTGRFSRRAAQHLLADVYLTRAYTSFGNASDFDTAASLAEQAIGSYDIRSQTYAEVFDLGNQVNSEVLFAVQYGTQGSDADRTNTKHGFAMNSIENYAGVGRNSQYGASSSGVMPTPYFYGLFADNDTRDEVTLHRVLFAAEDASFTSGDGQPVDDIITGDTVIYYPKNAVDAAELADKLDRYWVYQPDQYLFGLPDDVPGAVYQYSSNINRINFPIFKKFDDVGIDGGSGGSRDTFVFRIAETHLIAAEAYLGSGNAASGLQHLNVVRERATGDANFYTTLDIDTILDERAIELSGEENRWAVLKRTGKLEERTNLYNPQNVDHGAFDSNIHLLRPIPDNELLLSDGTLEQNPGY
ncbi:RagB/SusD family nutrient uptake outer membrane protein [Flagellimonas algicola]|uniref:RagB/SusD family nutrient uptake outer membrane protein n=1 Tax=Flagellimonas algicola TaxID=2583815 RepID=A0ABY2WPS0_9FLAO|nr:RagB/SusD family nutrient uptake outer membrane protein [Allomuricauda algicola]TMU56740.1 RagB/SusD family nutrient uptake outer membrane protein [Allomuricauda algicola]